MLVPQLPKDKDLSFCVYTIMVFLERLYMFQQQVETSPSLKTSGIESDIRKLQDVAGKMIEKLEKMKGVVNGD
jgi:hypothetical protein